MTVDPRDLTGSTIAGRYTVRRKLGEGGMGAVWLVQHAESLQLHALKTLHRPRDGFEKMSLVRFLREARAAAALRSKHVVKVIDAQIGYVHPPTGEPTPFIVMELLEGETLEALIRERGPLPRAQVVWVLRQVARALDAAHAMGIVHRDLKPENLFLALDEDGEPVTKVCDFGIAKLGGELGAGLLSTDTSGSFLGTPLYMSPEQAKNSSEVARESDQWAVGLIAFKALVGRDYFGHVRGLSDLIVKIIVEPLTVPTLLASELLPPAFDAWFFRSCARDPKQRWADVGEQVRALGEALGVSAVEAPRVQVAATRMAASYDELSSAPTQALPSAPLRPSTTPQTPASRAVGATTNQPASAAQPIAPTTPSRRSPMTWASLVIVLLLVGGAGLLWNLRTRGGERPGAPTSSIAPVTPRTSESGPPVPPPAQVAKTVASPIASTPSAIAAPTASVSGSAGASTVGGKLVKPYKPAPTAAPTTAASNKPAGKVRGAPCARSVECMSGFCVAEECT